MKIALGVSGGIAAYKAAEVVRLLQDRGIRVQVIMTRGAQQFVRPLTFAALSGEKVITEMFAVGGDENAQPNIDSAIEHIAVAQSIDALVVVPATAAALITMVASGSSFSTTWRICSADSTLVISAPPTGVRAVGPLTSSTRAPRRNAASASAYPMRPLERLVR